MVDCSADQAEGGFLVHGRPASEYRTHKPTAAISDFSVNKTKAAASPAQRSGSVPEPPEPAVAGELHSPVNCSCVKLIARQPRLLIPDLGLDTATTLAWHRTKMQHI